MKMYLNEQQTVQLMELGFEKPKSKVGGKVIYEPDADLEIEWEEAYSIGELIEMLGYDLYSMHYLGMSWEVKGEQVAVINEELIDALYDTIIKLKEEGVI